MAKRGNAESQFKLGLMYETGSGTDKSPVLATSWYKKAAQQDYKPASNRLTYLSIKKTGFKNKHADWLKSLKRDARFNEGEALFLLGQMYSEGTGVSKSLTRSLKLLRKAAGGNIPGSETEIARVEHELALLQEKYTAKEEKEKTAPALLPPANKIKKNTPQIKKAKVISKKPAKQLVSQAKKTPVKKQNIQKKQLIVKNKKSTKETIKKVPVIKPVIPEKIKEADLHPMDIICGGRNRFNRDCR